MATQVIPPGQTNMGTPANGDTVYIESGNATITTTVDWSSVDSIAILEVGGAFTGQVGSSSAPVKANISTRLVYAAASGDMYFVADGASADTAALIQVIGGGHFHFQTTGTATRFEMRGGEATIATACTCTNIRMSGGRLTLYDDSSTDPTLLQTAGRSYVETYRGGTTFTHYGGTLVVKAGSNAITTLNVGAPGTVLWNSGTISTINCWGGIPDCANLTKAITISATNIDMSLTGAQAFLDNPLITHSSITRYITDGR